MGRTLTDLVNRIINDVDEETGNIDLETVLKDFVNRGYKELAKRQRLEKKSSVVTSEYSITKPNDFYKMSKLIYDNEEQWFEEESDYISTDTNGDMTLIYFYIPADLTDSDEPLTNPANDEFIVAYAKYKYFQRENKFNNAEVFKRDYETFPIQKMYKDLRFTVVR